MASLSEEKFNPEEYLLDTLDNLDIGFVKVSNNSTILNHNLTFNKIFGYDSEKILIGTQILDYWLNSEESNRFREILFKNGIVKKYIAPAKKMNGEKFLLQINIKLNKNSRGEIISSEGTFVDVTERIETEQKLKESEEIHRVFMETAKDFMHIIDKKAKIIYVNRDFIGYKKEELMEMHITELIAEETLPFLIKFFNSGANIGSVSSAISSVMCISINSSFL